MIKPQEQNRVKIETIKRRIEDMKRIAFTIVAIIWAGLALSAATTERLDYTLYFNWKFVWIKAGTASLTTRPITYKGQEAVEATLLASSSGTADNLYYLRDTLTTTVSRKGEPLFFEKHCIEGKDVVWERAWYSRTQQGQYKVDLRKDYVDGHVREDQWTGSQQPYDLVSIMLHARSLDLDDLNVGQRLTFPIVDSKKVLSQTLVYLGRQQIKAEGGGLVECHAFSLKGTILSNKGAKEEEKEVLRFYLSTAAQHVPVQIDINFRFGSAKAKLR